MSVSSPFFSQFSAKDVEQEETARKRFKKPPKSISPAIRKSAWDLHIGIGVTEAFCPLCDTNKIRRDENSGFDAAHIIAQKWFTGQLSALYLIPSCVVCNNETAAMCILDFLFVRGGKRLPLLRRLIMRLYDAFVAQHERELDSDFKMAHRVLDHLYGTKAWSTGGIQNATAIYEMARTEQVGVMAFRAGELSMELQQLAQEMANLSNAEIRTVKI
jgi:hypothetical protein